jgi:hypothetical protein
MKQVFPGNKANHSQIGAEVAVGFSPWGAILSMGHEVETNPSPRHALFGTRCHALAQPGRIKAFQYASTHGNDSFCQRLYPCGDFDIAASQAITRSSQTQPIRRRISALFFMFISSQCFMLQRFHRKRGWHAPAANPLLSPPIATDPTDFPPTVALLQIFQVSNI